MNKLIMSLVLTLFVIGFMNSPVQAQPSPPEQSTPKVELTEKQQKEVGKLHKKMFETKKKLIEKYIEYGVLTKEKGDMILNKMEAHFKKMEENGFVPVWERHHHHD